MATVGATQKCLNLTLMSITKEPKLSGWSFVTCDNCTLREHGCALIITCYLQQLDVNENPSGHVWLGQIRVTFHKSFTNRLVAWHSLAADLC